VIKYVFVDNHVDVKVGLVSMLIIHNDTVYLPHYSYHYK